MNEQPELRAEALRWIEKADHDLRNAECVLRLTDDCPTDTVCFHCQQCAEKYLKSLLIFRGVAFPRTHDLVALLNLIASTGELAIKVGQVQPLNRYSVEARYPGDWDPIGLQEAREALNMARSVREAVRAALSLEA
ncbi:MAG: HEPN domain-containing protein [bacterium]|nr:HEPN domain-containing protein [bacterium]